jgi:hypothetical protein
VAQAAQNTASGATESLAAASSLSQMAAELQTLVNQFQVDRAEGRPRSARPNGSHASNGSNGKNGHARANAQALV